MSGRLILALPGLFIASSIATAQANDLRDLARQAGALKSYTFTVEQKPGAARPLEGKYQAGRPAWFRSEGIEFYRKGTVLVYLDAGRWQRSRTGTLSDPLRILGPASSVRKVTALPHEELPGLVKDLEGIKKTAGKEKGSTVYTGTLTAAGLKKWAPTEYRGVAREGTLRIETSDGMVARYSLTFRLRGRLGNAEVDGTSTRSVVLRDAGTTKVALPAAAKKALE